MNSVQSIVKKNLLRSQRSLISKLKCGVLPIALETGRWTDIPIEKRTCSICPDRPVETEEHFLTVCPALDEVRTRNLTRLNNIRDISTLKGITKMKEMFMPDMIKTTARMIEEMYEARNSLMYQAISDIWEMDMVEEETVEVSDQSSQSGSEDEL